MDDLYLAREDRPNLKAITLLLLKKLNEWQEGPIDQFNAALIAMPHTVYQKKTQQ